MSYRDNVEQAAAALKRGEDANWELARLTYESTYAPGVPDGQSDLVPMEQWCGDVERLSGRRFSYSSGRLYKRIWSRFGHQHANDRPSWTEAYDVGLGFSGQERLERQAATTLAKAPADTKRHVFQQLARDPDVIEEAAAFGTPTSRAVSDLYTRTERVREEWRERETDRDPVLQRLDRIEAAIDVEDLCLRFERDCERFAREVSDALMRSGPARGHHLVFVRQSIERAKSALEQLETYAETGRTDIDAFLADVLGGANHD